VTLVNRATATFIRQDTYICVCVCVYIYTLSVTFLSLLHVAAKWRLVCLHRDFTVTSRLILEHMKNDKKWKLPRIFRVMNHARTGSRVIVSSWRQSRGLPGKILSQRLCVGWRGPALGFIKFEINIRTHIQHVIRRKLCNDIFSVRIFLNTLTNHVTMPHDSFEQNLCKCELIEKFCVAHNEEITRFRSCFIKWTRYAAETASRGRYAVVCHRHKRTARLARI